VSRPVPEVGRGPGEGGAAGRGLADAKLRHPPAARGAAPPGGPPRPGEIRKALPMDPGAQPALVLVTGVDEDEQAHPVVLLTPDLELGGDRDLVLWPVDTGLPYAVAAQADVFGYVWTVQFEPPLGAVREPVLAGVAGLQRHEPEPPAPDHRAGPPIVSTADARWRHKERELARLTAVAGDCARQLVDGPPHVLIDPVALRPPGAGEDPLDALEFIAAMADRVADGTVDAPAWLIDQVLSADGFARAYRHAGLFDGYQVLVRLAESRLLRLGDEDVPEAPSGAAGDVYDALEQAQAAVLAQERGHGHSSVWLLSRAGDVAEASGPERRYVAGGMIQCVRTPCGA